MASKTTTDHEEIRRWAEERGGKPACVRGTGGDGDIGMLRIEFPDRPQSKDENLKEISWDAWFKAFDANDLALVYQETTSDGRISRFNKIVSRNAAEEERSSQRTG
jgi:hypothetical protein